jgi:translation elongation factor EF-1beta
MSAPSLLKRKPAAAGRICAHLRRRLEALKQQRQSLPQKGFIAGPTLVIANEEQNKIVTRVANEEEQKKIVIANEEQKKIVCVIEVLPHERVSQAKAAAILEELRGNRNELGLKWRELHTEEIAFGLVNLIISCSTGPGE